MGRVVARWWPIAAFIAISIVVQVGFTSRYAPLGHAADHLQSATAIFPGLVLVAVLFWSTPSIRTKPEVVLLAIVWLGGLLGVAVGNVQVVDAMTGLDWTNDEASRLGGALSGFDAGHELSAMASYVAWVAGAGLAVTLAIRRLVGWPVAAGSLVMTLICPPWIIPGAGVLVLVVALCVARHRRLNEEVEVAA